MGEFFATLHTLEWVYLALFCSGLLYALFLASFGFGHGGDLDHAADAGHGDLGHGHGDFDLGHGDVDLGHGHGDFDLGHGHGDFDLGHGDVDLGHGGDLDIDHDVDGDGHQIVPYNPIVIATFCGGFGAGGILGTQLLHIPPLLSLLIATPAGLALGGGMYTVYRRLTTLGSSGRPLTWQELRGTKALVTTPIPQDGLGEIVYVAQGSRQRASARTVDGRPLPRDSIVTVLNIVDSVAVVDERFVD